MIKRISTHEAARILGVSDATIRNWHRAGHLRPVAASPLVFAAGEIIALEESIRANRFERLRKRANKSASGKLEGGGASGRLGELMLEKGFGPDRMLYLAAMRLLRREGEVGASGTTWRRSALRDVMLGWRRRLGGEAGNPDDPTFDSFLDRGECADRLGLLYQGLSSVGKKSRSGAYFTPMAAIDDSLAALAPTPESFLDPCCGTGRYLLRAAVRFGLPPEQVHGFDSDPLAVDIARVNLLLLYRDLEAMPDIHCLDSLAEPPSPPVNRLLHSIDAIATNPPWGSCKNLRRADPAAAIRSGESFSLFLEKSLRLARPGGRLSFLLPEALLKIKTHADIRRLLLAETRIRRVSLLGQVFPEVFTPVIRLDLEKSPAPAGWRVEVARKGQTHRTRQERFAANAGQAFDAEVTPRDEDLLAKLHRTEHATLGGRAEWALGIVTGDNARHVLDAPAAGTEPVLLGRDVFKFAARSPNRHIRFLPEEFQQAAPERLYRAPEKLIYRFISDQLVFAYDDGGMLTLNSANVVIPLLPEIPMKAALAFLNSKVFQYIFSKRFGTRKVLRGDLEKLPFPLLPAGTLRKIGAQAERCMVGESPDRLNGMIYAAFNLRDDDIAAIEAET